MKDLVAVKCLNTENTGLAGVCLSFTEMVCAEIDLYHEQNDVTLPEKIRVKIGGDGA